MTRFILEILYFWLHVLCIFWVTNSLSLYGWSVSLCWDFVTLRWKLCCGVANRIKDKWVHSEKKLLCYVFVFCKTVTNRCYPNILCNFMPHMCAKQKKRESTGNEILFKHSFILLLFLLQIWRSKVAVDDFMCDVTVKWILKGW